MEAKTAASRRANFSAATVRGDVVAGLVSSTVAIPLAMAFGMFAFVTLGDEYFAYGAMAGLMSAFIAGVVCVVLGDRSTRVYAPRITTTFFLGLLLYSLLHRDTAGGGEPSVPATLLVFFAIILLGGVFQALFGLMRLGSLIKFAPHPVMAGFQNMAAVLLFLVQLGNVLGFDHNVRFTRVFGALDETRPLSLLVAALTFAAMWNARRITTRLPPMLVGLGCGILAYYALVIVGLGGSLGPIIGSPTASAAMRTVLVDFSGLAMAAPLEQSWPLIVSSALALAIIASIDALLCAKLASRPGELRAGDDSLLVRLGIANAISAAFGGITSGINIGPSLANRAFGAQSPLSVLVNAAAVLAAATLLFPLLAYIPRAVLSAAVMVVAIQHIEPWTRQLAQRLISPGTPQRGAIALDLGVCLFVSLLSIAVNVVLAVFIGIVLAVFLFVVRMSRSNIRKLYRCDNVRSRRYRDPAELAVLHAQGASVLVIELQGALFFGSAERLAQIVERETAQGTIVLLLEMRRITEIDSTGARILGDIDAALAARGIKLALVLSARTETAARLADIFHAPDRFFPDIDRAIEWAEDDLLRQTAAAPSSEWPLERLPLVSDFTAGQIERLRSWLEPVAWSAGEVVFHSGDPGSSLYLVTQGRASVHILHDGGDIRLATFAPGAVFGELALLDRGPRSATITADEDLKAFGLSEASFAVLCQQQPDLAIKLLTALGRELSVRIRYANMTIQQLET
ncbi:cyclic nucleotide-binding domain-containing protein [Bradyrhizobium sp. KBS0727]|uniref:SLC26A/SulP transporter family protein n=1 Tax=unclassified Bradyrhizobium TaxID=2631580 RepID=UPI00110D82B5|nr:MULTISPECIES: SulP family inorganic anion transporter [unclassified Bradyrhizobium]QDW36204.1 cyclic nucleotide-binding domain-containing protein [Bradyrhizobium sp. KBS0725]QDW42805.1 cyclic nucleotide-binding domain-containing protein [Bradyrhizobium sp. KBS0727]